MIKNLLFDMDMTLLDFHKAEHNALGQTLMELGIEPTEERLASYSRINLSQWKLLEQGLITRDRLKVKRFELFFAWMQGEWDAKKAAQRYESFLACNHDYMEGAEKLLKEFRGKYAMYIISNGLARVQHSRIQGAEMEPYFDGIFISEEVGYNKPDVRFFDTCFDRIKETIDPDFCREESVVIGDSLTSDIQGGINAGVTTIWLNNGGVETPGEIRADHEIHSLEELPALLERLN